MSNRLRISIVKKQQTANDDSDLRVKLTKEIFHQVYECMICYENIKANARVWSCKTCWAIFHMNCISKWGKSSESAAGWRCPGCQSNYLDHPSDYFCFCGKEVDPKSRMAPHSCQNTCGRVRDCSHPCTGNFDMVLIADVCHPGPCSPCGAMIMNTCYCGKESFMSKCATGRLGKISCGKVCSKLLSCLKHDCSQVCHDGLCSMCPIVVNQSCKCGKAIKLLECGKDNEFQCDQKCGFDFDCKIHKCLLDCHERLSHNTKCPYDPSILTTCPCGKTKQNRTNCADIVSTCSQPCCKKLNCEHSCIASCHEGECPPCLVSVELLCRCEKEILRSLCSEIVRDESGLPLCSNLCSKKNHCKRHRCGRRCCVMEVHICERICQKPLSCKLHTCLQQCGHPDRCHTCVEGVSFEERVCHCGLTKMLPPIPCNMPPLICHYPCIRPLECGHVSLTPHDCHPDSEKCPPCMTFAPKLCHCGSTQIPTPCCRRNPSCGAPCKGKFLGCNHSCPRVCHEGACNNGEVCRSICGKLRDICGHICRFKCHDTLYCPQDKPCGELIPLNCPCGRIKVNKPCGASFGNSQSITQIMTVECDDECLRLTRNALLSEALGIESQPIKESPNYESSMLTFALKNTQWIKEIESKIKDFISNPGKNHYYFPSRYSRTQNLLLLDLASYYNLFAELVDENIGKGTVIYRKNSGNVAEPNILLSIASQSFDPSVSSPETDEDNFESVKNTGMNGLYFTNLQLGLDLETLKTMICSYLSSNIKLEPIELKVKSDCAFVFKPNQANLEKTLSKILASLTEKLVDQNLVKSIQIIQVSENGEVNFKKASLPVLIENMEISSQNPFDLLKEKL